MPEERGRQRHAAQRAAAADALQPCCRFTYAASSAEQVPFADERRRKLLDVMQFYRTAYRALRHFRQRRRSGNVGMVAHAALIGRLVCQYPRPSLD